MTQKKFDLLKEIGFEDSLDDEKLDNYVGEVAAETDDGPDEQKKKRAAAAATTTGRSKMIESEFLPGGGVGMVAHPNIYVGGQQQYPEHFYPGMVQAYDPNVHQGQPGYHAYAQHPSYPQGFGGGHSSY